MIVAVPRVTPQHRGLARPSSFQTGTGNQVGPLIPEETERTRLSDRRHVAQRAVRREQRHAQHVTARYLGLGNRFGQEGPGAAYTARPCDGSASGETAPRRTSPIPFAPAQRTGSGYPLRSQEVAHERGHLGIVHMTDTGEEMVLDLVFAHRYRARSADQGQRGSSGSHLRLTHHEVTASRGRRLDESASRREMGRSGN